MILTYKLEAKHFQDFCTAVNRELSHVNGLKGQLIWGSVVGSIVAVAGLAGSALSGSHMFYWGFFTGAWFFWLVDYVFRLLIGRRRASLMYKDDGLVLGDRQLTVDDSGVHINGDLFSEEVSWKAIKSLSLQHLVTVLWTDRAAGIFVPRSAFATPEEEANFVTFVQSKIGAS